MNDKIEPLFEQITSKLNALKVLGIKVDIFEAKYDEAYQCYLDGEEEDALLSCEEMHFVLNLLRDMMSRQLEDMMSQKKGPAIESGIAKQTQEETVQPALTMNSELVSQILDHPLLRDQLLQGFQSQLQTEIEKKIPMLKESLMKSMKDTLEEEKPNLKSQLYNTLRYDILQYIEHKKLVPE